MVDLKIKRARIAGSKSVHSVTSFPRIIAWIGKSPEVFFYLALDKHRANNISPGLYNFSHASRVRRVRAKAN